MTRCLIGGSNEKKFFSQSYEDKDALDSAVLIMPLVFFISAADPRFTSTLDTILKTYVHRSSHYSNSTLFPVSFKRMGTDIG